MNDSYTISFTKEEIQDLIENLIQCKWEGYLEYSDPAYSAFVKLIESIKDRV